MTDQAVLLLLQRRAKQARISEFTPHDLRRTFISDLLDDPEPIIKGLKHLKSRGNDVIVFQVLDPHELTFPFLGSSRFKDVESADEVTAEPSSVNSIWWGC